MISGLNFKKLFINAGVKCDRKRRWRIDVNTTMRPGVVRQNTKFRNRKLYIFMTKRGRVSARCTVYTRKILSQKTILH